MLNAFGIAPGSVIEQLADINAISTDWLLTGSALSGILAPQSARLTTSAKVGLLSTYKSNASNKVQAPMITATTNTSSKIVVNTLSGYNLTGDISIAFDFILAAESRWVRMNPIQTHYAEEFAITIESDGSITFYRGTSVHPNYVAVTLAAALPVGVLQTCLITCNHTTGTVKCYIDGVLRDTKTYTPSAIQVKNTTCMTMLTGYCNEMFRGSLKNVRVWERELSSVDAKLNVLTPPDLDDGALAIWYPLDRDTFETNVDCGVRELPTIYVNSITPTKVDAPIVIKQSSVRQFNRLKNPQFDHASWQKGYLKNIRYNVVAPPTHLSGVQVTTFNLGQLMANAGYMYCYDDMAPQLPGEILTASVWMKITNTSGNSLGIYAYNANNEEAAYGQRTATPSLTITEAEGWKLMEFPYITAKDNFQDSLSFYMTGTEADAFEISMCAPMLERGAGYARHNKYTQTTQVINEKHNPRRVFIRNTSATGGYAKKYTIKLYDSVGAVVWQHVETNAVDGNNYYPISGLFDVVQMDIIITELSAPNVALLLDAFLEDYTVVTGDSVKPKTTDLTSMIATQITSGDLLKPKALDVWGNLTVAINKNEVLQLSLAETKLTTNQFTRTDIINPKVSGTALVTANLVRADALNTSADVLTQEDVSFTKVDTSLITVEDVVVSNTATFIKTDALKPKLSDTSFLVYVEKYTNDQLSLGLTDMSIPVTAYFTRTETLKPKGLDAYGLITANLIRTETLMVDRNPELDGLNISFTRDEMFPVYLTELSELTNVHSRMRDAARYIKGKIEVFYADPKINDYIHISVSECATHSSPEQLLNGLPADPKKWLQVNNANTNESYTVGVDSEVGWWGTTFSDNDGYLNPTPTLTLQFNKRAISELKLIGVANLDSYPVDFKYELFEDEVLKFSQTFTGNNQCNFVQAITPVPNINKVVLTISRITKAHDVVKLSDVFSLLYQVYEDDMLINFSLLEDLDYPTDTKVLGTLTANELRVTLNNEDKRFDPTNYNSPLSGYLKKNRKVKAYVGVEIIEGETEWYPLGVFWTTGWSVPAGGLEASLAARDILESMRTSSYHGTVLLNDVSLGQVIEAVLIDFGLSDDSYRIHSSVYQIILPYAWIDKGTHLSALKFLSSCADIKINVDRFGVVFVDPVYPPQDVMYTFSDDYDVFSRAYPAVLNPEVNYVEVIAQTYALGNTEDAIGMSSPIILAANEQTEYTLKFSQMPYTSFGPLVCDNPNIEIITYNTYSWGLVASLKNNTGTQQSCLLSRQGQRLVASPAFSVVAKNVASINDQGENRIEIKHELIQDRSYAQELANSLLSKMLQSRFDVSLDTRGHATLVPGDRIAFIPNGKDPEIYQIKRQTTKYDGTLASVVEGLHINGGV